MQPDHFIYFPSSPWSEKARWALDYCGHSYKTDLYLPLLSIPKARLLSRNFSSRLTVPILIEKQSGRGEVYKNAMEIAAHANGERDQSKPDIFPQKFLSEIKRWDELSEELCSIRRSQAIPVMKGNKELLKNNLPPFVPKALRPYLGSSTKMVLSLLEKKYQVDLEGGDEHLRKSLSSLRIELSDSRGYILDNFSYADMSMCAVLQCIKPVDPKYLDWDKHNIEAWTHHELADEFKDLIEWRDGLYERFR